jgi:hypothetical protein
MPKTTGAGSADASPDDLRELAVARTAAAQLLPQSVGFQALDRGKQRQVVRDVARIAVVLAERVALSADETVHGLPSGVAAEAGDEVASELGREASRETAATGPLLSAVDFPAFVADLLKGVFDANVDTSIEQMEAFSRLLADVCKSLDEFRDAGVSKRHSSDYLLQQHPDWFVAEADAESERTRVRLTWPD